MSNLSKTPKNDSTFLKMARDTHTACVIQRSLPYRRFVNHGLGYIWHEVLSIHGFYGTAQCFFCTMGASSMDARCMLSCPKDLQYWVEGGVITFLEHSLLSYNFINLCMLSALTKQCCYGGKYHGNLMGILRCGMNGWHTVIILLLSYFLHNFYILLLNEHVFQVYSAFS